MNKKGFDTDLMVRYLTGEVDTKSKEMIDKIIHDDEKSRREFDAYVNVWEKSAELGDYEKVDAEKDWLKVRSRMRLKGTRKRIPFSSYLLRVAAILIFAFGLAYILIEITKTTTQTSTNYLEIASSDQAKEVQLPDGSIVHLNKYSKIIRNSNYGKENRDIILEGEAFFGVVPDKELPFKVHSLNSTVEVLGTSFNVHTDSLQVRVSVIEGKVAFYESDNTENRIELAKDHTGIFEIQNELLVPMSSIDYNQLAWHTGKFNFQQMPLKKVCHVLADYYNLKFSVADQNIQFVDSINGNFSTNSLDSIIRDINSALTEDIRIYASGNRLVVSKQ